MVRRLLSSLTSLHDVSRHTSQRSPSPRRKTVESWRLLYTRAKQYHDIHGGAPAMRGLVVNDYCIIYAYHYIFTYTYIITIMAIQDTHTHTYIYLYKRISATYTGRPRKRRRRSLKQVEVVWVDNPTDIDSVSV